MISDGHLTIWFVYICVDFSFDIDIVLLKIDIYNNMIHYLNITSWLLCRCLVISYSILFWLKESLWQDFLSFYGGDVTYMNIFIFKFTCGWPEFGRMHSPLLNIVNLTINSHMALIACFFNINMFITPNSGQWEVNPTVWLYKRSLFYKDQSVN